MPSADRLRYLLTNMGLLVLLKAFAMLCPWLLADTAEIIEAKHELTKYKGAYRP